MRPISAEFNTQDDKEKSVESEWVRWLIGTIITVIVVVVGAHLTAVREAREGDRRLHERIDKLISETQQKIDQLQDEAKNDRHELVNRVYGMLADDRRERDVFRERIYEQLRIVGIQLASIRGLLRHPENPET